MKFASNRRGIMTDNHSDPPARLSVRHLRAIEELTRGDVDLLLHTALGFSEVNARSLKKVPTLRGRTVALMFFESSTRTRLSFELAAKRLSADTISFSATGSSVSKGETLLDTARNIEAMKPDLVIVRHGSSGAPYLLSRVMSGSIINAGDGQHEHPTQALLDAFTLLQHWGRDVSQGLAGKTIAIVGDIARSRVARSNMLLLPMLGAKVRVVGPAPMLPAALAQSFHVEVFSDVDDALLSEGGVDAVMMLRIQKERSHQSPMGSDADYAHAFGLTGERFAKLRRMKPDAVVLHPGPINRGVEIASEVADDVASLILAQTENGIALRMATLYLLSLDGGRS
jgi:aspartate carbamoyltransferase catalytic subunit